MENERELNRDIVELGAKARRVMENEDFVAVLAHIHADLFKQFRTTNLLNVEVRDELHRLSYAVGYVEKKIENYVDAATAEIKMQDDFDAE